METGVPRPEFSYVAIELVNGMFGTSQGMRWEVFPYHIAYWVTVNFFNTVNFLIPFQIACILHYSIPTASHILIIQIS